MVVQYKCPDCGADMAFDSDSGKLSCPSCGRQEAIENMPSPEEPEGSEEETVGDFEDFTPETSAGTFGEGEASQYQCQNCGAVLIAEGNTAATTCSFCGAPMILGDRLSGSLAPSRVIPFTISKEKAREAFKKWCRKGLLTPKDFKPADRIKNITGIYIPFWLFDLNGRGEAHATCTRVRTYTQGDYIYTETKYFDVYRKVDLNYNLIPADASKRLEDGLMDKLEPFRYQDLKDFNIPYLAGYIAEKYDYTDKELFPRVKDRASHYVEDYIASTITGYSSVIYDSHWTDILQRRAQYALLPVWMVCYDYRRSDHNFMMNGQTGKIVGTPPMSKGKLAAWFGGISAGVFVLLKIIGILLGGGII